LPHSTHVSSLSTKFIGPPIRWGRAYMLSS
jgi:hypothetical protein